MEFPAVSTIWFSTSTSAMKLISSWTEGGRPRVAVCGRVGEVLDAQSSVHRWMPRMCPTWASPTPE